MKGLFERFASMHGILYSHAFSLIFGHDKKFSSARKCPFSQSASHMKKYEGKMKKYVGNMKEIRTLPTYRPWDSEKFRAHPLITKGGGSQFSGLGYPREKT